MGRLASISAAARESGRSLLIPYLVCGDPTTGDTLELMHELVRQGADIIELGVPFSDPSSDGPVIQRGVERALAGGTTLCDTLAVVTQFRKSNDTTPIVLMGYLNPVEIMGYEKFALAASEAGVDGMLLVDMPPGESEPLHSLLQQNGIDTIYLVAPTTTDLRRAQIIKRCSGYLYYVSLKGVTGAALSDSDEVGRSLNELRNHCDLPIVVGFGIKDGPSARRLAASADGVVVGSVLVESIGKLSSSGQRDYAQTCHVIGEIRDALDS
jgi:tryptophan synthase alpha chain